MRRAVRTFVRVFQGGKKKREKKEEKKEENARLEASLERNIGGIGQFRFLRAASLANIKGSVGLILSEASAMRISIPIEKNLDFPDGHLGPLYLYPTSFVLGDLQHSYLLPLSFLLCVRP